MIKVFVSSVIDTNIEDVWMMVRDFNSLPNWHPVVAESRIEGGGESDAIGCIRNLNLQDGANVREQLLMLSDSEHRFSYSILDSDVGLLDYVAEFALMPITDGDLTYAVWSAEFRTEQGLEEEKSNMVAQNVFQGGFDALKACLNRK